LKLITPLEPSPAPDQIPDLFPSPFDELGPHPLARAAAMALQAELRTGSIAPGLSTRLLEGPDGGKMFGVLVVQSPDGEVGFLRAFSGMLAGRWDVEGFVPPLFDRAARESFEPAGEAQVKALFARAEAARASPELSELRARHAALVARHAADRTAMHAQHLARHQERHMRRAELASAGLSEEARLDALHALERQSKADKAELRRLKAEQLAERAELEGKLARLERRLRAHDRLRRIVCVRLMRRIHDTYVIPNARGETRPLRALFPPPDPLHGAGDCAGTKLLAYAYRNGLRPLALAEFWWGNPPLGGGRVAGVFYPACRDKCGFVLPFMLEGLRVAPPRTFAPAPSEAARLEVVYEDPWIVVVEKPCGLLSVPARDTSLTDSVLSRLRALYPHATGPLLVHRLDLDTSGLLVAALDAHTHAELQRQFLRREVHKRYVAWVDGCVRGERGAIDLAIRVDLDDRPRQIHDPVHGKRAVTEWQVLERRGARTHVALFPLTGRTHQLRVHAAHPLGLGAPIVGDRLYGRADTRLHLHAEAIPFRHPETGMTMSFERPAPF
jgi:tRNA pseudouridine32 synthase/23S rRNA pseudouridine746 synthase